MRHARVEKINQLCENCARLIKDDFMQTTSSVLSLIRTVKRDSINSGNARCDSWGVINIFRAARERKLRKIRSSELYLSD